MKKSDSITDLSKALCKFQGEVKDPRKSQANPFLKSKYVPLDELLTAVRPVLSKNGLSFIQIPYTQEGEKPSVSVVTVLMHESGEWLETEPLVTTLEKDGSQAIGSAITYAKRYSLSSILGVAWDDDDDGEAQNEAKRQLWDLIQQAGAQNGKTLDGIKHYISKEIGKDFNSITLQELQSVYEWAKS